MRKQIFLPAFLIVFTISATMLWNAASAQSLDDHAGEIVIWHHVEPKDNETLSTIARKYYSSFMVPVATIICYRDGRIERVFEWPQENQFQPLPLGSCVVLFCTAEQFANLPENIRPIWTTRDCYIVTKNGRRPIGDLINTQGDERHLLIKVQEALTDYTRQRE